MCVVDSDIDYQILASIQEGEKSALAALYDRHHRWMLAVAVRILNNRNDAEDLLHDVFVEIWSKAGSYDKQRGTVPSWLAVKIRSRALDRLRSLKTMKKYVIETSVDDALLQVASKSTVDAGVMIDHELARSLMSRLSPVQQTVLEFSYFKGLSCQEIASHCQMPLGTVKTGLLRGVQALRREIKKTQVGKHASR
ncbi:MAG: sigma-70 family RNA polymerase sigma factor [Gammaproteobacteria bacterium]|nr:sigma-70 family RNA polymerase sigma factor [Gammaproteobacteria bacterium]